MVYIPFGGATMGDNRLLLEMGARIKDARKAARMTQEVLAEKMDVSIQMISNLELGKKAIRPENIVKLCAILNISADYILRGIKSEAETSEFVQNYKKLSFEKQHAIDLLVRSMI